MSCNDSATASSAASVLPLPLLSDKLVVKINMRVKFQLNSEDHFSTARSAAADSTAACLAVSAVGSNTACAAAGSAAGSAVCLAVEVLCIWLMR